MPFFSNYLRVDNTQEPLCISRLNNGSGFNPTAWHVEQVSSLDKSCVTEKADISLDHGIYINIIGKLQQSKGGKNECVQKSPLHLFQEQMHIWYTSLQTKIS